VKKFLAKKPEHRPYLTGSCWSWKYSNWRCLVVRTGRSIQRTQQFIIISNEPGECTAGTVKRI